ncbi:adenosylcobinamide-GDP ribazoletransferase [Nioella nitratireducens]|uniref:adenosylcobinamide-GDP ribazoletransferase n=1 Tax=Nioella nitratireducens TaxID=1287720 RepID=UPI0009FC69BA|nr:adenosylcobinamide-GDP ribazoletransferase [Nioella nitratireducens]
MAPRDILHRISGDLRLALGLLTRLPLPGAPDMGRGAAAAWAWPLAGLAPGGLMVLAVWAASGLGEGLAAALGLAVAAMATGAMHEDGLADTADGFWGGWTVERRLEIMKDSRIGTYGVLALILSLLARWSLVAGLVGSDAFAPVVLSAAMLSRGPMVGLMAWMEPARPGGLSRAVGRPPLSAAWLGGGVALLLALLLCGGAAIWAALAAVVVAVALGRVAQAKVGGQTGDVLGASQQLSEIAVLAVLSSALP